ncbi:MULTISPECIES: DMT family transporter [Paenibacillus]|jgi:paired small multidrug resistance pump|uniref:QacE family quaternary ammonium compound efflux SMR transporter n=1 Tax=Paenibacillus borealis TaxID=160799 RepID=A0ABX3HDZ9_PAEBO|nr:multidrug efflux SMR transporter [Paenibacillus borealis]OMD48743.1 QacE family quaternary ammonium compound efflux SMR transporter [Paenibacillus borealis]
MAWLMLIAAGCCEMFGVAMIGKLHRDRNWQAIALLVLGFGGSFLLLSLAMESLPMGTAYAVWTGIGASGGAILGMVLYGEARDLRRIICIVVILGAAVGLKMVG